MLRLTFEQHRPSSAAATRSQSPENPMSIPRQVVRNIDSVSIPKPDGNKKTLVVNQKRT